MKVPDSGSQPLDSGSQHLDSGFQPFGFRIPTFQITYQSGFRILVSGFRFQQHWKFAGFRIPDFLTWGDKMTASVCFSLCNYEQNCLQDAVKTCCLPNDFEWDMVEAASFREILKSTSTGFVNYKTWSNWSNICGIYQSVLSTFYVQYMSRH